MKKNKKKQKKFLKPSNNELYKNFAVIGLGWLGDTFLADGVCKNIKRYNPEFQITFVASKTFVDVPKLLPEVDEIIVFDKNGEHKGILGYLKFSKFFKNKKIDVAIIIHLHERSVLYAMVLEAKKIVSLLLKGKFNPLNLFINEKSDCIEEIRNTYKNNVYTSQYESFGLPPLEAMSCGCPVITSNNSSLPEVVGPAGIMIDWDNDKQHIEAYEKYYYNEDLRKEYIQKGLERAKDFSWKKCTDKIIEGLQNGI